MAGGTPLSGQFRWRLTQLFRKIWVRVTAFAVLGILTALAGFALKGFIPGDLPARIGADAIESILQILASSMLAVTTFSLSILTAAYAAAGTTATPRAVHLLVSDSASQTVLATFIGAFLFSLVSIIILKTGVYGQSGRVVLFAVTILVVLIIVISLLRWIELLSQLGRVGDTLQRIEAAAGNALSLHLQSPWLGGSPMTGAPPVDTKPVLPDANGFLQHCDTAKLSNIAEDAGIEVYLAVRPGDFLHLAAPAFHIRPLPADDESADELRKRLLATLTIDVNRSFDQDPRFGLSVLSEAAQRALSPGINDPGTAKQVVTHILNVLSQWRSPITPNIQYPRLFVPTLSAQELLTESILPIGRDGAGDYWVQVSLQQALLGLAQISPQVFAASAADLSRKLLTLNDRHLILEDQRAALKGLSAWAQDVAQFTDE